MVAFFNYNMDDEWDIRENSAWPLTKQKNFMEKLGKKEGYKKPEEWIGYPKQALKDNGGYGLLKLYKSVERVVKTLIPKPEIWFGDEGQLEYTLQRKNLGDG